MTRFDVRHLTPHDDIPRRAALTQAWGMPAVARRGELIDLMTLDGFVAVSGDEWLGLLTYAPRPDGFEVVAIHAERQGMGVGRALMDAARARAVALGSARLWLSTTNDNIRALRFYQQWGMDLVAVLLDGVARSRLVKPIIPATGEHGIPIRHEIEFELRL
jgi:ribosomal protein S18 acetylase RimI-like enzyme